MLPNKGYISPNRGNITTKYYNNSHTSNQEPEQPRSYLANLFREPSDNDPIDAQIAQDIRFGHVPMHTIKSASLQL